MHTHTENKYEKNEEIQRYNEGNVKYLLKKLKVCVKHNESDREKERKKRAKKGEQNRKRPAKKDNIEKELEQIWAKENRYFSCTAAVSLCFFCF